MHQNCIQTVGLKTDPVFPSREEKTILGTEQEKLHKDDARSNSKRLIFYFEQVMAGKEQQHRQRKLESNAGRMKQKPTTQT